MYEFIRGKLFSSTNNRAVVDANGVGYSLGISLNSFASLPEIGEEILLFAHYHVTENSQALYGFVTSQERELFEVLISINKIGPKVALSALSTLSVEQIVTAVENQDVNTFKSVSGVGPKTAQRILLELKGKLKITVTPQNKKGTTRKKPAAQQVRDEAYTALIALGYTEQAVRVALMRVEEILYKETVDKETVDKETPIHEWITTALKVI